jgi:hypothetical protein
MASTRNNQRLEDLARVVNPVLDAISTSEANGRVAG